MEKVTPTTWSYLSSAALSAFGGLTFQEAVALAGIILAVLTFLVNWKYRDLHYRLEKARHDAETKDN